MWKKAIYVPTIFLSVVFSKFLFADWSNPGKLDYFHTFDTGFAFSIQGVAHNCGNPNQQFFVAWSSDKLPDRLYTLVLFSFGSGKSVAANYSCQADGLAHTSGIDIR